LSLALLLSQEWDFLPLEELLQQADAALYAAKVAGRNCMKVAIPKISPVDPDSRAPGLPGSGADRHARLVSRKLSRFTNPKCP